MQTNIGATTVLLNPSFFSATHLTFHKQSRHFFRQKKETFLLNICYPLLTPQFVHATFFSTYGIFCCSWKVLRWFIVRKECVHLLNRIWLYLRKTQYLFPKRQQTYKETIFIITWIFTKCSFEKCSKCKRNWPLKL